jgi:hypothetical protein
MLIDESSDVNDGLKRSKKTTTLNHPSEVRPNLSRLYQFLETTFDHPSGQV